MEEGLEQTAQITSRRSFLGALISLRIYNKGKNPALVGQNVCVHSGHRGGQGTEGHGPTSQ